MVRSPISRNHVALAAVVIFATACHTGRPPELFPAGETVHYEALVSVHWVKQLLDHQASGARLPRPTTYASDRFVVLEVGWGTLANATDYRAGHLPGATYFDTDAFETGYPIWQLREPHELQRVIGLAGIDANTTVIVCGRTLIAAARVWWVLKYAGVADVRLMDGGVAAWSAAGYPLAQESVVPTPVDFAGPVAEHWLATTRYVHEHLDSSRVWMADVRSDAEFRGLASGYSYLDACGRIPGAIPVGDGDDKARMYVQPDGHLRPPAEILAMWRIHGLTPAPSGRRFARELIFYCGSGWRSSVAFFYAWLLGFENMRNYSDGWCSWSTHYRRDAAATGSTPGWRQLPTGNPIDPGDGIPNR